MTQTVQFTRMDEGTAEQWAHIAMEHVRNRPRVAERVLMLLESLGELYDGFGTDQLTHALQTATRAERDGADEEVIVASLCHDIGKAISVPNHAAIAAEILKPYVRQEVYDMIRVHQDFQGKHYYQYIGKDPNLRVQYKDEPFYDLAERFADDWDQTSFDPDYPTEPLSHFEDMVRRVFATPSM